MLKKKSNLLICLLLLTFLVVGFLPISHIAISSGDFDCVNRSKIFSLRWRHSVEKQLWYEYYRYQDQQFELFESWLQTFGAGTPSQAEHVISTPKGYIGYKHTLKFKELHWAVSPNMEGEIHLGNQVVPIAKMLPAYSIVNIKPTRTPLAFYLLRSACDV